MGNKTQLQANNENLASILSNVLGLPSQESLKRGAYVWKKYRIIPAHNIILRFIQENHTATPVLLRVETDIAEDFPQINADTFIGYNGNVSGGDTAWSFSFSSGGVFTFNGTASTYAYDKENHKLEVVYGSIQQIYEWPNYSVEIPEYLAFVDYVISDSSTAYPDRGEQGGYWYEKFQLDPALFGHTKVSFGEVTPSSDLQTITVNHNLGGIPKMMLYYTPDNLIGTNYTKLAVCNSDDTVYGYRGACVTGYGSSNDYYDIGACVFSNVTESSAGLTGAISAKFKTGSTYHWLALA